METEKVGHLRNSRNSDNSLDPWCNHLQQWNLSVSLISRISHCVTLNKAKSLDFVLIWFYMWKNWAVSKGCACLWTLFARDPQIFKKSRNHLQLLGVRMVTWSRFHTVGHISGMHCEPLWYMVP